MDTRYEVIFIGAGPGGEVCAAQLGKAGKRVAIVESERVGGECAFWLACLLRFCCGIHGKIRVDELPQMIQRFPTFSEAFFYALQALEWS